MSESPCVHVQRDGDVAVITMDRPERRNTLSAALVEGLRQALDQTADAEGPRVLILTGAGDKAFCAGGDLAGGLSGADGALSAHAARAAFGELLLAVHRHPRPVIAALNGDALGGGFGLALACDLVVADPAARLGTPEVHVGLFPMVILAELSRNLPRKLLAELVYTGRKLTAHEAAALHLVNRVSPPGQALLEARTLAAEVVRGSPAAQRLGKAAVRHTQDLAYEASLAFLTHELGLVLQTDDAAEGIGAFLQRRPPVWRDR